MLNDTKNPDNVVEHFARGVSRISITNSRFMAKFLGFSPITKLALKEISKVNFPFDYPGIYAIKNTANGKIYVGQSKNMFSRVGNHRSMLIAGTCRVVDLQDDFNKLGIDSFEAMVLLSIPNGDRYEHEANFIKQIPVGLRYNLAEGSKHCQVTKERISQNSACAKAVFQCDMQGNVLFKHASFYEATRFNGFKTHVGILNAAAGKKDSAYGYLWRYVDETLNSKAESVRRERQNQSAISKEINKKRVAELMKPHKGKTLIEIYGQEIGSRMKNENRNRQLEISKLGTEKTRKKVAQYSKDGILIAIHNSITEAEILMAGKLCNKISMVCRGKKKSYKGFIWKYSDAA